MEINNYKLLINKLDDLIIKLSAFSDQARIIIQEENEKKVSYINTKEIVDEDIEKKKLIANLVNDEEYHRYKVALIALITLVSVILSVIVGCIGYEMLLSLETAKVISNVLLLGVSPLVGGLFGVGCYLFSTKKYRKLRKQYDSEDLEREISNLLVVSKDKEQKIILCDELIKSYQEDIEKAKAEIESYNVYQMDLLNNIKLLEDLTEGNTDEINRAFHKDSKAREILKLIRDKK